MDTANQRAAQARDDDRGPVHGQPAPALPRRFVKIPTSLLGKILDYERRMNARGDDVLTYGHASANAIHALAIKLAIPKHVLNKRNLKKTYGIGWRRFAESIRVLKERGVLDRSQKGRGYATERIIGSHDGEPFVPLDKALLAGKRSTLVAFVAAVNLSPDPQRPEDVAGRFGITSADGVLPKPIKPRPNMLLFERGALLQAIERMRRAA